MFKPFFIHRQTPFFEGHKPKFNGFTAYVEPHEENDRLIKVRVSFCSKKDRFCKRTGRAQVLTKAWTVINKRELPKYIGECEGIARKELYLSSYMAQENLFLLKYVV